MEGRFFLPFRYDSDAKQFVPEFYTNMAENVLLSNPDFPNSENVNQALSTLNVEVSERMEKSGGVFTDQIYFQNEQTPFWHNGNLPIEKGTWSPTFGAGISSNLLKTVTGNYTRTGNLVYAQFYVEFNTGTNTGTGAALIYGLPFAGFTFMYPTIVKSYAFVLPSNAFIVVDFESGTRARLEQIMTGTGVKNVNYAAVQWQNILKSVTDGEWFRGCVVYMVN